MVLKIFTFLWLVFMLILSHIPGGPSAEESRWLSSMTGVSESWLRTFAHMFRYAVLGVLVGTMSYRRKTGDKRRLRRTYLETRGKFLSGVGYDEDKGRLVRYWPGSRAQYLRRVSNRRVRKARGSYPRELYRKIFDYWWELD